MTPDAIRIRPLSIKDLPDVAAIHAAAFPDAALTSLGSEAVRRYYHWQLTGPHDAVALAALAPSEIAGFCVGGLFRGALSGFLNRNRAFLAWRVVTHPWIVSNSIVRRRLPLAIESLVNHRAPYPAVSPTGSAQTTRPATRERSFGVLSVAVHPRWRGRHIGSLLMREAEAAARARGFRVMHLTVAPDNRHAVEFYEHLDWDRVPVDGKWNGAMRKVLADGPRDRGLRT